MRDLSAILPPFCSYGRCGSFSMYQKKGSFFGEVCPDKGMWGPARAHGGRAAERALGPGPFAKLLNEFVSQRSYFLLASLNYLMNLFPRRSYFLLADFIDILSILSYFFRIILPSLLSADAGIYGICLAVQAILGISVIGRVQAARSMCRTAGGCVQLLQAYEMMELQRSFGQRAHTLSTTMKS